MWPNFAPSLQPTRIEVVTLVRAGGREAGCKGQHFNWAVTVLSREKKSIRIFALNPTDFFSTLGSRFIASDQSNCRVKACHADCRCNDFCGFFRICQVKLLWGQAFLNVLKEFTKNFVYYLHVGDFLLVVLPRNTAVAHHRSRWSQWLT